jgi:hypothetical protein
MAEAMDPYRVLFDALEWHSPAPGLRFKAWRQGNKQLRLLEHAREFIEPDWCEKAHCGLVLEGELEIDLQGRCVRFPQGSALCIPKGDKHKGRPVGARVLIFLVEDV